jgi:hypothetical protein
MKQTRIITLSNRSPIEIIQEDWNFLSSKSLFCDETATTFFMGARENPEGGCLVYATYGCRSERIFSKGGYLIQGDPAPAVRRLAQEMAKKPQLPGHHEKWELLADLVIQKLPYIQI